MRLDFTILSSVDKGELKTIKASYMENGLMTCIHRSTKTFLQCDYLRMKPLKDIVVHHAK